MKGITGVIVGAVVVVAVVLGIVWYQNDRITPNKGGLVVGVTDMTADISGVSDIQLQITKVEVHNQAQGWVEVSSRNRTYNLLDLKNTGRVELYAHTNMDIGAYDRVRITLGDVKVVTKSGQTVDVTIPGKQLVLNGNINVKAEEDAHLKLDFLADQSLHTATDNRFVFAPVVEMETRSNATINIENNNSIKVSGGNVDSMSRVGMDLDGTSKNNFKVNSDVGTGLKIENSPTGGTQFNLNGQTYISTNTNIDSLLDIGITGGTTGGVSTGGTVGGSTTGTATGGTTTGGLTGGLTTGGSVTGGTTTGGTVGGLMY